MTTCRFTERPPRKKGKWRFGLRTLFTTITLIAIVSIAVSRWPIDGPLQNLKLLFRTDGTAWAQHYTDDAFQAVQIGMTRDEVHALLGPPIETYELGTNRRFEHWTRPATNGANYRVRLILFKNNIATYKEARVFTSD